MNKKRLLCMKYGYLLILLSVVLVKVFSYDKINISVDGVQREFALFVPAIPTQEKNQ